MIVDPEYSRGDRQVGEQLWDYFRQRFVSIICSQREHACTRVSANSSQIGSPVSRKDVYIYIRTHTHTHIRSYLYSEQVLFALHLRVVVLFLFLRRAWNKIGSITSLLFPLRQTDRRVSRK